MLQTAVTTISAKQLRRLKAFGDRISAFGHNFAVCTSDGELLFVACGGKFESDHNALIEYGHRAIDRVLRMHADAVTASPIHCFTGDGTVVTVVLSPAPTHKAAPEPMAVAIVDLGEASPRSVEAVSAYLKEMLELLCENFQTAIRTEKQIEKVGTELAQTYEELVLLHKLGMNMKVTEADTNFLQMACDSLTEIVLVEGIVIMIERVFDDEHRLAVAAGSGVIEVNERMANIIYSRLVEELNIGKEALLDSNVDTPMKYEWPKNVQNIIAVPLYGKEQPESQYAERTKDGNCVVGMMVAVNRVDKEDFDSIDIKLFNSVANGCAVFIDNGRLFKDLKELFLGSLMALTSSIDAKDQYTRGHSERVAFISRWIAERVGEKQRLSKDQIHRIYLAGLLHDIGKIGVDESVLRKNGPLTEEERERIKAHPAIGAGILATIRQMKDIVPGVLCHHERMDGLGYPQGLKADQIPLIGKIVQLADTFDAMTSRRSYRDALSIETALCEIEKNLGKQFDEEIGKIFLAGDIDELWNTIRDGFGEIHGIDNLAEYGTAAVGTLIR